MKVQAHSMKKNFVSQVLSFNLIFLINLYFFGKVFDLQKLTNLTVKKFV